MDRANGIRDRGPLDLILVIAATWVSMAFIEVDVSNVALRAVFTLPLVLLLPGYALMASMFPRCNLGVAEQVLLSLGLSLAVTALGGVILNWTPWGLQTDSWSLLLGLVTFGGSAVALIRRPAQPIFVLCQRRTSMSVRQAGLLGLAALVLGGAVAVAHKGAAQQQTPGFTQLWALPANAPGQQHAIRVGVKNMEATTVAYQVEIVVNGKDVMKLPLVKAAPQHTWETTVVLPRGLPTINPVEVVLYRADAPGTVYRHVELWLNR